MSPSKESGNFDSVRLLALFKGLKGSPLSREEIIAQLKINREGEKSLRRVLGEWTAAGKLRRLKAKRYLFMPDSLISQKMVAPDSDIKSPKDGDDSETEWESLGVPVTDFSATSNPPRKEARKDLGKGDRKDKRKDSSTKKSEADQEGRRGVLARRGKFFLVLGEEGGRRVKYVVPSSQLGNGKEGQWVHYLPLGKKGPMGFPAAKIVAGKGKEIRFEEVEKSFAKEYRLPFAYPKLAMREAGAYPELHRRVDR
jgi:hypothetical protein